MEEYESESGISSHGDLGDYCVEQEQDDDDDDDTDDGDLGDYCVEQEQDDDEENEVVIDSETKRQRDDDVDDVDDDTKSATLLLDDAKTMSLLPKKLRQFLEWSGMTPGQFVLQHNGDKQKLAERYISFCKDKYNQTIQINSARTALASYSTRISESRSFLGCSSGDSVVGSDSVGRGGGKTTAAAASHFSLFWTQEDVSRTFT